VTETTQFHKKMLAINEALMLGSMRQHELTEAAESLNVQLQEEITERKLVEAALRESEERYRTLFNSIDEGFCVIEKVEGGVGGALDFRYLEVNPAFATQSGMSDVVEKTIRQAFPDEPEEWCLIYDTVLRTGEPIRFERGLVSHGRVLELYAFRVEDKTHRRVAVIFKDITERKRTEERIHDSEEKFRTLADNMSQFAWMTDETHDRWRDIFPAPFYFDIARTWWAERASPNLLCVHFNDLKADLDGEMRRIAGFLGIEINEAIWPKLVEAATFASMKRHGAKWMPNAERGFVGGHETFLHKGTNDRWRDVLSADELALYEARVARETSPALARWLESGRLIAGDPETTPD